MDALVDVRHRLALAIIGRPEDSAAPVAGVALGRITLRPHQVDAAHRLLRALRRHRGALLADAPGLGKTYTALCVAHTFGGALVVGPAALRAQWAQSAALAGVPITWCSLETLSRRGTTSDAPLLIVDEAHHLRTPHARRYAHAAELAMHRPTLLLSATPVHNRGADRDALLALFLGAGAAHLSDETLASLIVRRDADAARLPRRLTPRSLAAPRAPDIAHAIRTLPAPLPAADGRAAAALVRLTLAHAWSSSLAALDAACRRALLQGAAFEDALAAGRWPTRRELRAWATTDESSQLAFPLLVATESRANVVDARATLEKHRLAVRALRQRLAAQVADDATARAQALRTVLAAHPGATVIAFAHYAATVDALWRAMQYDAGVVAITSRGVRSAGGGLRRRDVLAALTAPDAAHDARLPLRLVLTTDLLGEGLDLRAASVIVHLDQPWTPARLEQREGRALRLDSPHRGVAVYAVRPPQGAARLLALGRRLLAKRDALRAAISPGRVRERLCGLVRPWLAATSRDAPAVAIAAVSASSTGWVAVITDDDGVERVVHCANGGVREDDASLVRLLTKVRHAAAVVAPAAAVRAAQRAVRRWLSQEQSARLAGTAYRGTGARTQLLRQLDTAVRNAPLHERSVWQRQAETLRAQVIAMRGAGADRLLQHAARATSFSELAELLHGHGAEPSARPTHAPQLVALLILLDERPTAG